MKKVWYRLAGTAVSCMLAAGLCGCHGSRGLSAFAVPEQLDESRTLELTFWAKNDTNKNQTKIYEEAIASFEKLYPNIRINMRLYTDYGKIYNDVITNISTNTTPNICITYPDHIATYMTGANVVTELDELMENEKYGLGGSELKFDGPEKDEIIPEFLDECILSGHYYAVPFMRSSEAVYINKTFVEKLGYEVPDILTWDQMYEIGEAAMKKNPDGTFALNGQNVMIPIIYKSTDNMMISSLKQKGAGYSRPDGTIEIFNDTTKEILYEVNRHAATGAFSTFSISSYPANFLNAGQCLFAIDSTAGATWMGSHAPLSDISPDKFVEFETEVRMIPQYDPSDPYMISQGPSVCIFNKNDPQEVLASWLFMQYLLTNEVQTGYSETEGYVPVTTKAVESEEYQEYLALAGTDTQNHYRVKIEAADILRKNVEHTFTTPVFNGSASLRNAAGQMVENVAKSARRKETVDDAYMEKLFRNMESLYRLNETNALRENGNSGPLPIQSRILLGSLALAWILIGASVLYDRNKRRRTKDGR